MDDTDKKILEAYTESILGERKFDLGSGTMGNGVVVWNRAKEVHGDYEKVAHIDSNRKVTYYIKKPPKEVTKYVEGIAKGKNFGASTSQPDMKVFKEGDELTENIDAMAKKLIGIMKKIAKEDIKVEYTGGSFYVFGSELATLRIFMKYSNKGKSNPGGKFDVGYSENLKKFYFRMEV